MGICGSSKKPTKDKEYEDINTTKGQESNNNPGGIFQGELHQVRLSYNCYGINAFIEHIGAKIKIEDVGMDSEGLKTKTPEF